MSFKTCLFYFYFWLIFFGFILLPVTSVGRGHRRSRRKGTNGSQSQTVSPISNESFYGKLITSIICTIMGFVSVYFAVTVSKMYFYILILAVFIEWVGQGIFYEIIKSIIVCIKQTVSKCLRSYGIFPDEPDSPILDEIYFSVSEEERKKKHKEISLQIKANIKNQNEDGNQNSEEDGDDSINGDNEKDSKQDGDSISSDIVKKTLPPPGVADYGSCETSVCDDGDNSIQNQPRIGDAFLKKFNARIGVSAVSSSSESSDD